MKTARRHSTNGSPNYPVMLKTKCECDRNAFTNWATNYAVRKRTFLRDGIYELRASVRGAHCRVFYFFHKQVAAVVAHGIVKESSVPDRDIDLAIRRKLRFETDPKGHTLERE